MTKDILTDVQLDEDQNVEVNEDEVLSEDSLLLQTEVKASNGEAFASEEDLLATPVSKEAPKGLMENVLLTPSVPASVKAQTDNGTSKDDKAAVVAKKAKTKVTLAQPAQELKSNDSVGKVTSKGLSAEERIALRSKKFNMPMSDTARLKVRMERFGAAASNSGASKDTTKGTVKTSRTSITANPPPVNLAQLKKRAERFGQSVSTVAKDLEEKERLLKRKQRFDSSTPAAEGAKRSKTIII